jgi:hypothetical protein
MSCCLPQAQWIHSQALSSTALPIVTSRHALSQRDGYLAIATFTIQQLQEPLSSPLTRVLAQAFDAVHVAVRSGVVSGAVQPHEGRG